MIVPAFLNIGFLLGMGIDLFNYTSTTRIYDGAENGARHNVSYETVRYLVTQDPSDVFTLMGVPPDLAIRFLDDSAKLSSWSGTVFSLDITKFWKQPEVFLAVSITRTTVVDRLAPDAPMFSPIHPAAALDTTHYVAEVGYGNQVLAIIGLRPSHPDDLDQIQAAVQHRLGGAEGPVRDNFTEALSLILRDLNDTTVFRGPLHIRHQIFARTDPGLRGGANDLVELVPFLRNYTLRHTMEMESGFGAKIWLRLESAHKANASFPRLDRWTVLTEYKEQMFRHLVSVFLDLVQARRELRDLERRNDFTEEQEQKVLRLYELDSELQKIRNLATYGSIYGQTSADLKLLKAVENYRTSYEPFMYIKGVRQVAEEIEDLIPCYGGPDPSRPTKGLPRAVLQTPSSNITTLEDCARACAQDSKCRMSAVGVLATDPSHVRCWTFRHSVSQHTFLVPLETTGESKFLSRECIAMA